MPKLFDPLAWLRSRSTVAYLADDNTLRLRFGQFVRWEDRRRILEMVRPYEWLLRLQLDVPAGTTPRSVQQLVATGRLRLADAPRARWDQLL